MSGVDGHRTDSTFDTHALAALDWAYPEMATTLRHRMADHPLFATEALALLAESLPPQNVEYNLGDLPIGIAADAVPGNGLSIAETIRRIADAKSWAVLKNVESVPAYRDLLMTLLSEIRPIAERTTGRMLKPQAYIFISSPGSITPFHFDPEHNILMQLHGRKSMTVFPAGDDRFAPPQAHEAYHIGNSRNLSWRDEWLPHGTAIELTPGDAAFVPVMAPHFVRNGPEPSLSLSITWRSDWSFAEADARAFNGWLRRRGLSPAATRRFPGHNRAKALAWRGLRRLGMGR